MLLHLFKMPNGSTKASLRIFRRVNLRKRTWLIVIPIKKYFFKSIIIIIILFLQKYYGLYWKGFCGGL